MTDGSHTIDITHIRVEPVHDYFECEHIHALMSRHHALGSKRLIGKRMVYGIYYREYILGAFYFDKAVDRNRLRESEIGWSNEQRDARRQHIANNSRFLILPESEGIPNFASKALSLVTARISGDWQKKYGIPLVALETYVDGERNNSTGTCYQAAGWSQLGLSTGFGTSGGERTHSKWYFLKPLHKHSYAALSADIPHALLTGVKPVSGESNNNYVFDAGKVNLKELQEHLSEVPDPRSPHGTVYPFLPLLSLCVGAILSGYTQYRQIADWISRIPGPLRVSFGMPGDKTPDESTIGKFLARIDAELLQDALNKWLLTQNHNAIEVLSLDGKAVRGTSASASTQEKFLNLFANELGIVVDQIPTAGGSGEKIAARKAIEDSDIIEGKIILADAMHTDKNTAELIEKKKLITSSLSKTINQL